MAELQIDNVNDLQNAPPVAPGSIAYLADRSKIYAVANNGQWVETVNNSGGSGGGTSMVIVNYNNTNDTLSMKAGDMFEACKSGIVAIKREDSTAVAYGLIIRSMHDNEGYLFT